MYHKYKKVCKIGYNCLHYDQPNSNLAFILIKIKNRI